MSDHRSNPQPDEVGTHVHSGVEFEVVPRASGTTDAWAVRIGLDWIGPYETAAAAHAAGVAELERRASAKPA